MLLFCILVVPNNGATSCFNYGTVNVLAVCWHYRSNSLHPLLALNFEELFPLFSAIHEPIAAFGWDPEIFLLHQVWFEYTWYAVSITIRYYDQDVALIIQNFLYPLDDLGSGEHIGASNLLGGQGLMVNHDQIFTVANSLQSLLFNVNWFWNTTNFIDNLVLRFIHRWFGELDSLVTLKYNSRIVYCL